MTKKKTIEEVKAAIELIDGYELLSDEYIGSKSKLEILHKSCGIVFWMSWSHFQQGQRCPKCCGKLKLKIEDVKKYIESFDGHKLLSKEYINARSKLEILCSCGKPFWTSWDNFNHGHRCKKCHFESVTGENHHNWNYNLTDEEREKRRFLLYRERTEWIKAVYKRDDHKCQKCLVKGGSLVAHHIMPYALFPKIRWNVDNGITFCKSCHKYYHSIYGNGLNCNHETIGDHLYLNVYRNL